MLVDADRAGHQPRSRCSGNGAGEAESLPPAADRVFLDDAFEISPLAFRYHTPR